MSDRSPGGTVVMVSGGMEGGLECRGSMTCVLGLEFGFRRVASDPNLSGYRSMLRVGFGF
jgi:hypothetical protein